MKHYAHFGFSEFVIALGYKGEYIKRWIKDFSTFESDMTVNTKTGEMQVYEKEKTEWIVDLGGHRPEYADWRSHQTPSALAWRQVPSCSLGAMGFRTSI